MKTFGIITGVLMCILGIYVMLVPFRMFLGIGWLLGIMMVVKGVQTFLAGWKQEAKKNILQ